MVGDGQEADLTGACHAGTTRLVTGGEDQEATTAVAEASDESGGQASVHAAFSLEQED